MSRSAGRSVVAAAAYRLGARLEDREYDCFHDYERRGGVEKAFTLAPDHAPAWALIPERLWNAAEEAEKRRNSQVGRECELALPSSLDAAEREQLVRDFAEALIARYGVALSVGIHSPSRYGDERNHHAHILMTTREMTPDGLGAKTRLLDDRKTGPQEITWMRETAATIINRALDRAGSDERVTHLSFEARGIDQVPTEHLGPSASEMERRSPGSSDRADRNRDIEERNQTLDALVAELATVNAEIIEAEEQRLDDRYGAFDPAEPAATNPHDVVAASFKAAIQPAIDEVIERQCPAFTSASEPSPSEARTPHEAVLGFFEATIDAATSSLRQTGETSWGARLWQKTAELYRYSVDFITDFGREIAGYWQRVVAPDRHHEVDLSHEHEPDDRER